MHKRRVSTAVINEVLEEAISHSPQPVAKDVREKFTTAPKLASHPSIALFVNDAKRFNDNYRRYIERQFRQQLGFPALNSFVLAGKKPVR